MKNYFLYPLVLVAAFLSYNSAYSQDSYVVNSPTVNIRSEPNTKAKIIGKLTGGDVVSIINSDNSEWWRISFYGTEGYVASKFLVTPEASPQYKNWQKEPANTGDNPECENIIPKYDYNIDNRLLVHVGKDDDVVIKLMNTYGTCIRIAYIKANDDYTIRNIPEGIYYLKIAYGKDFRKYTENGQCNVKFLRDAVYEIGNEKLNYYKVNEPDTREGDRIVSHWTQPSFELSLNAEFTGKEFTNFHSNKVSVADFNK